jgi:uncharacterized protein
MVLFGKSQAGTLTPGQPTDLNLQLDFEPTFPVSNPESLVLETAHGYLAKSLSLLSEFRPDIIHCHDRQSFFTYRTLPNVIFSLHYPFADYWGLSNLSDSRFVDFKLERHAVCSAPVTIVYSELVRQRVLGSLSRNVAIQKLELGVESTAPNLRRDSSRIVVSIFGDIDREDDLSGEIPKAVRLLPESWLEQNHVEIRLYTQNNKATEPFFLGQPMSVRSIDDDLSEVLAETHILVSLKKFEPAPYLVLEAIAAGCFVLVLSGSGVDEYCKWGKNALAMLPTAESIVACLTAVVKNSASLLDSREISKATNDLWTTAKFAKDHLDLYLKVLGGPLDFELFEICSQDYLFSAATLDFVSISKATKALLEENPSADFAGYLPRTELTQEQFKASVSFIQSLKDKKILAPRKPLPPQVFAYSEFTLKLLPTRNCNLACKYCFSSTKSQAHDMSVEMAKESIDFFIENIATTPNAKINIDLTGAGEILLRLDFVREVNDYVRSVKRARGLNIFTSLCSNGHLLTEEVSTYLKKSEILYGVSLDGGKFENEESRLGIDYPLVLRNLKAIKNKQFFGIASTFSGTNYDIRAIFESIFNLGVAEAISIKPVRLPMDDPSAISMKNVTMIKESFSEFMLWMLDNARAERYDVVDCLFVGEDYFAKFLKFVLRKKKVIYRCSVGLNTVSIDHEGKVLMCPVVLDEESFIIGSISQGLDSEKVKWIRDTYADTIPFCKDCWARYYCGGECFGHGHIVHGDFVHPVEAMCELNKHLIKLACHFWRQLVEFSPHVAARLEKIYK